MKQPCDGCPTPTACATGCRYPYRHDGPAVYGSKAADALVSEISLREDGEVKYTDLSNPEAGD